MGLILIAILGGKCEGMTEQEQREKVAYFLRNGPKKPGEIMKGCGIGPTKIRAVMECPFFTQNDQGWHLTSVGRQAVG